MANFLTHTSKHKELLLQVSGNKWASATSTRIVSCYSWDLFMRGSEHDPHLAILKLCKNYKITEPLEATSSLRYNLVNPITSFFRGGNWDTHTKWNDLPRATQSLSAKVETMIKGSDAPPSPRSHRNSLYDLKTVYQTQSRTWRLVFQVHGSQTLWQ